MDNISPELKDIIEMIHRYCATNKNNVCFLYSFIAFKKDLSHKCEECGEDCDEFNEEGSRIGAYGNLFELRVMVNELRDIIEDEIDEDGFVNI